MTTAIGERNACRKRKPGYVFEQDRQGYYTVETFDPLGSVISYLRNRQWEARHQIHTCDAELLQSLLDAEAICVKVYNS